ncbi:type I polyketide synthase [Saccharothrix sp. S26]|uniref:type I polyketide synthase n=1 Tax=Saccharothrix sp. S26 TaxID=2907215 RepID=UPI001F344CB2|nr:type I polyketide synthase [Saccharothrix sp. S26]MCE6998467.1 type I polyketide synthase [Saccharothrix sp. S26]
MSRDFPLFVDVLRDHAVERADDIALIVLADGETEHTRLTYAELDARVRELAARMQHSGLTGERVIILLPTSVEYVVSVLACLYAGAVPVPLNPPTKSTHRERVDHVVEDCRPALAIVSATDGPMAHLPEEYGCGLWSVADLADLAAHDWSPPATGPDDVAYLQYTSGSTSRPRGVVVTHDNIVYQPALFSTGLGMDSREVVVTWLPLFHDFGLIAGLFMPLLLGATTVMIPPPVFVQRPLRWLAAVSKYRATVSFSPNFPLDLCCERITEEEKSTLDLSTWRVLALGAEPIRADTVDRFAAEFASCGFRPDSFRTAYGMAESTLAVATHPPRNGVRVVEVDVEGFARGRVDVVPAGTPGPRRQRLLSNGPSLGDTRLVVVDPETREPLPEGREGEIWLSGRTVAAGYWNRPDDTAETFGARLADGTGPYLRSGDLGTVLDREVYITSRRKDLIIIRGRNHHPQDIELTMTDAHPALNRGLGVAFSVDVDGEERLVVVQEVKRTERGKHDLAEVARKVRGAVAEEHDVAIDTVVFIRPASLPVTTSGKVRRQFTKQAYLRGELKVEHVSGPPTTEAPTEVAEDRDTASVVEWLRARVAARTGLAPSDVPVDATFGGLGLDSAQALGLSGDLAAWLGRPVDPATLYGNPTILRLAVALTTGAGETTAAEPVAPTEPIAVVGMACAFPGADSVGDYWSLLVEGRDAVTEVPADRWSTDSWYREGAPTPGHSTTKWGGFLSDVAGFDARFFGVSAEEAAAMDPQQRLLLATTWRALEDAGVPAEALAGADVGVFVGISTTDYGRLMVRDHVEPGAYTGTGTSLSVAAGRLSYFLDLTGPSTSIDTACSSSLVAVHNACESLRRGECDTAIVGGVNVLLDPDLVVAFSQAGMMSPTGSCKTFDAAADGYVRGEGCGVVVLKRRADAERDQDRIRALVVGSAVNQDGRSNTLTAPNALAQQAVMRRALAGSGLAPGDVGYVEAHGTGTSLGDPVELAGIAAVYGAPGAKNPLWVGSAKTNLGHLEAAAGVAGLLKAILAVEHGLVPPHLHFDRLNPHVALDGTRCRIPTEPRPWSDEDGPRVAAVSSFGFSGTNAHVIVRQAPQPPRSTDGDSGAWRMLPLYAKSDRALAELTDAVVDVLERDADFAALCRVAQRRTRFPHRATVVARTAQEASGALREHRAGTPSAFVLTGTVPDTGPGPLAWSFPGQGFARTGMARPLYRHDAFRDALGRVDAIVRGDLGVSLLPTLAGEEGDLVDLTQTRYGQPAMFATQYAVARLWQEFGVEPDYLIGHSLGELTAAAISGVLTLEDATGLVLSRARLMHQTPPGAMYAVRTQHIGELLRELEDGEVTVAAFNSPEDVTISGPEDAAERVATRWVHRGAKVTRLNVNRAFHSPLMEPVVDAFADQARHVRHHEARVPIVSTLTGELLGAAELTGAHWVDQLRRPVRFAEGLRTLDRLGVRHFAEMSPEPVLSPLGPRTVPGATWLTSGHRQDEDDRRLVLSLAAWHSAGGALASRPTGGPVDPAVLPGHPLRADRHWYTPGVTAERHAPGHPLLGHRVDLAGAPGEWFSAEIGATRPWFVDQHRIGGAALLPGAAMVEWVTAAAKAVLGGDTWTIDDVRFTRALVLEPGRPAAVQAVVDPVGGAVDCYARGDGDPRWTPRARAGAVRRGAVAPEPGRPAEELAWELVRQDPDALYSRFAAAGMAYGPAFRGVRQLWLGHEEAVGRISVDTGRPEDGFYTLHPVVLDACLHVAAAFIPDLPTPLVPVAVEQVVVHGVLPGDVWSHAKSRGVGDSGEHVVDVRLTSTTGAVVAELRGLVLRPFGAATRAPLRQYTVDWVPAGTAHPVRVGGDWLIIGPDDVTARDWAQRLRAGGIAASEYAGRDVPGDVTGLVVIGATPTSDDLAAFEESARHAVLPLREVLPGLAARRPTVVLCTEHAAGTPGDEPRVAPAALAGLAAALTAEYPDLPVVHLDHDGAAEPADVLTRAVGLGGSGRLALRDGEWRQARLRAAEPDAVDLALRADGTFVITGGWGALGRVTARHLVEHGARHLALVGRNRPEPDPDWVVELRQRAEVVLLTADVADEGDLHDALGWIAENMPPLCGVVHAAGTTDDGAFADLDWSRFEHVLAAKARGAWNLHRLTRGRQLDLFVVFSSFASLIGSAGQANYVVANAFLDALADVRRARGMPGAGVNWGPWSDGGLAAGEEPAKRLARGGLPGISDDEGASVLSAVLAGGRTRLGLAKVDWDRYLAVNGGSAAHTLLSDLTRTTGQAAPTAPDVSELVLTDPEGAEAQVTELLLRETSVLLGLSAVDREELRSRFADTKLTNLGLDSLMGVRLRDRLLTGLSVALPGEALFDGSTVRDVVKDLCKQIAVKAVVREGQVPESDDLEVVRL